WPDVDRLKIQTRGLEGASLGDAHFVMANVPVDGRRLNDLFDEVLPENVLVTLFQWFAALPSSDLVTLWAGYLSNQRESIAFDDAELTFDVGTILDRYDRTLGDPLTSDEFPSADPDDLGRIQPEIWGAPSDVTCLAIDAGAMSPLREALAESGGPVKVSDASRFTDFPLRIQVEDEWIDVSGKSGDDLTVSGRGAVGTVALAHDVGMQCWELRSQYDYLVARRPVQAITAVRVDDVLQPADGSVYDAYPSGHPDYFGRPIIRFKVKPIFRKATNIVVSQEHSHATAVDQQPEVAASVTQQPGFGTDQGSHAHGITPPLYAVDQLAEDIWPLSIQQGGRVWSFPQVSTAIQTVYTFERAASMVVPAGGSIQYNAGGATQIWLYPNGPPVTWQAVVNGDSDPHASIYAQGNWVLTLLKVSRSVQYQQAIAPSPAAGVNTSRTADALAAAERTVDADASTARVGNTALGGNSTAEVVVGRRVSADVQGVPDDGSGTYTGTPNALIQRPDHVRKHVLMGLAGIPVSLIHAASFAAGGSQYASWGYAFDGALTEQIALRDLLQRMDVESRSLTTWDSQVRLAIRSNLDGTPPAKTISASTMRPDTFGPGRPLRIIRTPRSDVANAITALYRRDYREPQVAFRTRRGDDLAVAAARGFRGSITRSGATSIALYGERPRQEPLLLHFVSGEAMAAHVADFWLAQYQHIRERVQFEAYLTELEIEPGDVVAVNYPGLANLGDNAGEITEADPQPAEDGKPDGIRLEILMFYRQIFRARLAEATRILEALTGSITLTHDGQEITAILEALDVRPTVSLAESSTISEALALLAHYAPALTEATAVAEDLIARVAWTLSEGTLVSEAVAQLLLNEFRRLGEGYLGVNLLAQATGSWITFFTDLLAVAEVLSSQFTMGPAAEGSSVAEAKTVTLWTGALGLTGLAVNALGGEAS
ncbi:MAG: hypothetical protein HY510_07870, partial [Acidobacteria bacterium]|nr:hypothetical protein [Acidobacteriota bacterium]